MITVEAGWMRRSDGERAVALHIPGRRYRVILSAYQYHKLAESLGSGRVTPMQEREYARFRRSRLGVSGQLVAAR